MSEAGTRQRIVTATIELFRRHGYAATSLKQISALAGAPIGSLYHHFPGGKEDIAAEALASSGEAYRQLFVLVAAEAGDPSEAVTAFFDGAALALEESDYVDVCPIGGVAREVASNSDRLRAVADAVFRTWVDTAVDLLQAAGCGPEAAQDLAVTMVGAIEGGFLLSRTQRDPEPLRIIGRQVRRLVDSTLAELAPAPDHR